MTAASIKKSVGYKAAELIQEDMLVGIGTGSTVHFFIEKLGQRCSEGLKIQAVSSSSRSSKEAQAKGIPLIDIEKVTTLDITVDGADEIDPQKRLIKGAGGAHVREKILATMSRELVIIADESKLVDALGRAKLPVEILPFAHAATLYHMKKAGYKSVIRRTKEGSFFITDNNNLLVDIHFTKTLSQPEKEHETLMRIPGVVDTGFFFHLAGRIIVGFSDGQILIKS
jgi:ribose 5-phosphate isomerase A